MDEVIYMKCPKCGGEAFSEGVNVDVGYYYPPFHCFCGWSEMCDLKGSKDCIKCTEYENCYSNK